MSKKRKQAQALLLQNPCNATAMRKASRRLTQLYDGALEESGLRSTQYAILTELDRSAGNPPTMRELAQTLVIDRSALGHNLRPLERDGLIALHQDEADRRRRHIVLTEAGRERLAQAKPLWHTAQSRFDSVYGKSNAAELRAALLSIAHNEKLASL